MDLLLWGGLTNEEIAIRMEESLQTLLPYQEKEFFRTIYQQYLVIIKLLPEESWPSTYKTTTK
ncbi:MAG: hypothetical protein LIP01_13900 [Tannerellaceae bacterium]|nr:hypothetical protein [Tannerellaceae bacterium]